MGPRFVPCAAVWAAHRPIATQNCKFCFHCSRHRLRPQARFQIASMSETTEDSFFFWLPVRSIGCAQETHKLRSKADSTWQCLWMTPSEVLLLNTCCPLQLCQQDVFLTCGPLGLAPPPGRSHSATRLPPAAGDSPLLPGVYGVPCSLEQQCSEGVYHECRHAAVGQHLQCSACKIAMWQPQ